MNKSRYVFFILACLFGLYVQAQNRKNIPRFIHDLYLYNYIIIYHVPVKRYANNKKHPSNHCILTK